MPVMPIAKMTTDLLFYKLESFCFYPADERRRDEHYLLYKYNSFLDNLSVDAKAGNDSMQIVPIDDLLALLRARPYEKVKNEGDKKFIELCCVGFIVLFHLYMTHTLKVEAPSVRKCIQFLAGIKGILPHVALPTSEQSYWNYWKRLKTVRHLCVGRLLTDMMIEDGNISGEREVMGRWLSLSDSFLRYGSSSREPTTGKPLIQKEEAWTFPDWLSYGEIDVVNISLNFPFFDEFLKTYHCQDYLIVEK